MEMAAAYAVLPIGHQVEPRFITKITDANGRVLCGRPPRRREVLDPRIAYLLTDMMKGVTAPGGTASSLGPLLERIIAAKTGTSQNHRDSFMVGYTPELVTAVWVGNDDNNSLGWGQTGAVRAGQVWVRFVNGALRGEPVTDFTRPPGLSEILICPETGLLHNPRCSHEPVRELFIPGTEPAVRCSWPECPYCPPEPEWNWNEGWWYNRPGDGVNTPGWRLRNRQ